MKWLTKLADVALGLNHVAGLVRMVAAALAALVAASAVEPVPEPAAQAPLGIVCSGSCLSNPQ